MRVADFHFNTRNGLAAGTDPDRTERIDGHDGGRFGHAIAGRVADAGFLQKGLHIKIQGGAAEHEKAQRAAQGLQQFFAGESMQPLAEKWHAVEPAHQSALLQFGQNAFAIDLVHYQRNREHAGRFDHLHAGQKFLRRRHALQVIDGDADRHGTEHAAGGFVGVRERQNGQKTILVGDGKAFDAVYDIVDDVAVRQHNAFGVAGGAGGINDGRQILLGRLRPLALHHPGFLPAFVMQSGLGFGRVLDAEIFQRKNDQRIGFQFFQFRTLFFADKYRLAAGMAYDMPGIVLCKAGQYGHDHPSGGGDRQIGYGPVGAVFSQQSNAIPFVQAEGF